MDLYEATFDPDFGFPITVRIDIDRDAADDEWAFSLISFEPIDEP